MVILQTKDTSSLC